MSEEEYYEPDYSSKRSLTWSYLTGTIAAPTLSATVATQLKAASPRCGNKIPIKWVKIYNIQGEIEDGYPLSIGNSVKQEYKLPINQVATFWIGDLSKIWIKYQSGTDVADNYVRWVAASEINLNAYTTTTSSTSTSTSSSTSTSTSTTA